LSGVRVSAIVPVFDPGADIDDCIRTLTGQTLPREAYEVIFVDDGSTDGTAERLDALAAEHPNVRVEHIPNSGWPGRPRNVGLDLAQGEFVYFVDNDDYLELDAFARLLALADSDGADVVVGKVVGHGKGVPRDLFRRNLHAVGLGRQELLGLLAPHKLFRRAFLQEHGIRFPEGRRRLEDHPFVMGAYLAGAKVSVLAEHPVYHWVRREPGANASARRFDPQGYYGNVREVLDLVGARVPESPRRDRLLAHWYQGKMLARVGGSNFLRRDPDYRRELFEAVRELALERYGEEVHERLPFNLRIRSRLLRDGDFDGLLALAEWESGLLAKVRLRDLRGPGTFLIARLRVTVPVDFERRGERFLWIPPELLRDRFTDEQRDATDGFRGSRTDAYLWRDDVEWPLEGRHKLKLGEGDVVRPAIATVLPIAPSVAAAGGPLPAGEWELRASASVAGFTAGRIVRDDGDPLVFACDPPARISPRAGAAAGPVAAPA
jgi:glycosyltransferase involved in cell wall biosynthesis